MPNLLGPIYFKGVQNRISVSARFSLFALQSAIIRPKDGRFNDTQEVTRSVCTSSIGKMVSRFLFKSFHSTKSNWGNPPHTLLKISTQVSLCTKILDGINEICHCFFQTRGIPGISRHTRCRSISFPTHRPTLPICRTTFWVPLCTPSIHETDEFL